MKIVFILIFLFITITASADTFKVPFSCYPKQLQTEFAEEGLKLDLSGNDRTEKSWLIKKIPQLKKFVCTRKLWGSWGFIENKGTSFVLYTYKSATEKDLILIRKIITGE